MRIFKVLITITVLICIIGITNFSKAVSNDTSIKSINIEPSDYELVQDENDNKIYRVKVDNSVTSVKVNVVPNNKDTTISVSGNENLIVGTNKVTVSVTAQNGNKSTYTIYIRRASTPIAQENVIPNVQEEQNEEQNENIESNNLERNIDNNSENSIEDNSENNNKNIVESSDENKVNNNSENNIQTNTSISSNEKNNDNDNHTITGNKKIITFAIILCVLIIIFFMVANKKTKGKH